MFESRVNSSYFFSRYDTKSKLQEIIVQVTNFLTSSDRGVASEMQWCKMTSKLKLLLVQKKRKTD